MKNELGHYLVKQYEGILRFNLYFLIPILMKLAQSYIYIYIYIYYIHTSNKRCDFFRIKINY